MALPPINRPLSSDDLNNRFGFHRATIEGPEATAPKHTTLRGDFFGFAAQLNAVLPEGRAKSLAMTALEEASMWSHKAIAETAPLEGSDLFAHTWEDKRTPESLVE